MLKMYATFLAFFILQKIIFTYVNADASAWPLTIGDATQIVIHGLGLDLSTTGYLSAIPFIVIWAGMWLPHLNHKTVLAPYFISNWMPPSSITWMLPNKPWPASPRPTSSSTCCWSAPLPPCFHGYSSGRPRNISRNSPVLGGKRHATACTSCWAD